MIRTKLMAFAAIAALAACSSDKPKAEQDPVRLELDQASAAARSRAAPDAAPNTPTGSPESDQVQSEEDTELPTEFAGMIPWDATRDGLVTTETGLQIHVLSGGGADGSRPSINDSVSVNYEGRLASDGSKFDSSFDRGQPAQFGVTQVIPGWTETLQLMRPGDDWLVHIPSELGYGASGTPGGPIPPDADLIFRVVLEDIIPDTAPGGEVFDKYLPWDDSNTDIQTTDSGLEYLILARGDQDGKLATATDTIITDFEIRLAKNSQRIESSYLTGEPARLPVPELFLGWQEAVQLMRAGDDFLFRMTPEVAFGPEAVASGRIPPDDVVLRVNLQEAITPPPPQISNTEAWATHTPWNSDSSEVIKSDWGVEYVIIESGDENGAMPDTSSTVEVYYEGRLVTGETFDSSYERGASIEFPVTGVIKGWTDTLQRMRPGDRWLVYIPSDLAYGDNPRPGVIKPGDDLIFEMQLIGFR